MKFFDLHDLKDFNKRIHKNFMLMLILFIASAFLTRLILIHYPQYVTKRIKELSSILGNESGIQWKEFIWIFLNNLRTSVFIVIVGLIPYLFLSVLMLIYNGYIIGLVIAEVEITRHNALLMILLGILPHGIFELTAIFYAASIGVYITKNVTIFRPKNDISLKGRLPVSSCDDNTFAIIDSSESDTCKKEGHVYLKDIMPVIIKSYVFIIIPLLAVAAFIEAFITPELLTLMKR